MTILGQRVAGIASVLAVLGTLVMLGLGAGCGPRGRDLGEAKLSRMERCVVASFEWEDAPEAHKSSALLASIEKAEAVCPKGGFYGACLPDLARVSELAAADPTRKVPALVGLCVEELCPVFEQEPAFCRTHARWLERTDLSGTELEKVEREVVEFHVQMLTLTTGADDETHGERVHLLAEAMSRVWIAHVKARQGPRLVGEGETG